MKQEPTYHRLHLKFDVAGLGCLVTFWIRYFLAYSYYVLGLLAITGEVCNLVYFLGEGALNYIIVSFYCADFYDGDSFKP